MRSDRCSVTGSPRLHVFEVTRRGSFARGYDDKDTDRGAKEMSSHAGTVIILGAGPAGLATGFALSRAGWLVKVFEQAPLVGGLARTIVKDDFRFDIGGHRWFTKKDELNHFLVNLLGDELVLVDRVSRVYFDGKYVEYPLR